MNKKILIIGGSALAVLAGATVLIVNKIKKDKAEKDAFNAEMEAKKKANEGSANKPVVAENVIGKKAYVSAKNGMINLRETPKVDNGVVDNLITSIKGAGTVIGSIVSVQKSDQNPPEDWYEVKLDKPVKEWMISWDVVFVHAADVDVK
jgi:hypothetical protein